VTRACGAWRGGRGRAVAAAALLATVPAPAFAQEADTAASCVPAAAPAAGLVRWACAGKGFDAAVRFSVAFPAGWEVASPGDAGLQAWALREGVQMAISAEDPLHEPRTRSDSLGFWMRATRLRLGREPTLAEVDDFQRTARRPSKARTAVTRAQLADSVLLAMARALSAANDGEEVRIEAVEVRRLGGAPAGYLSETYDVGGVSWHAESYVTVRDAVVFIATLTTMGDADADVLPLWERVRSSLRMRTQRPAR